MPLTLTNLTFSPRFITLGDVTTVTLTLRNDYTHPVTSLDLELSASAKRAGISPTTGRDYVELGRIALHAGTVNLPAGASADFTAVYHPQAAPGEVDFTGRTAVDAPSGATGLLLTYSTNISQTGGFISRRWSELTETFGILAGYLHPRILTASACRADASTGEASDEGMAAHLTATLSDGAAEPMSLKLFYRRLPDGTEEQAELDMTDRAFDGLVTQDGEPLSFTGGAAWALRLTYGDDYERAELPLELPRAFANLHLSAFSGGGACFGGFSTASADGRAKLECHYPAFFYGGIERGVNDYSLQEARAGTWIDGRPIYRRSLAVKRISGQDAAASTTVANLAAWHIDLLIRYEACMAQSNGTLNTVPAWWSATNFKSLYIDGDGLLILRHAEGSTSRSNDLYVTLWYVKEETNA